MSFENIEYKRSLLEYWWPEFLHHWNYWIIERWEIELQSRRLIQMEKMFCLSRREIIFLDYLEMRSDVVFPDSFIKASRKWTTSNKQNVVLIEYIYLYFSTFTCSIRIDWAKPVVELPLLVESLIAAVESSGSSSSAVMTFLIQELLQQEMRKMMMMMMET